MVGRIVSEFHLDRDLLLLHEQPRPIAPSERYLMLVKGKLGCSMPCQGFEDLIFTLLKGFYVIDMWIVFTAIQVLLPIYCGHEFGNEAVPNYAYSSIYYKPRNGSPPWRPDDKDGHFVFAIGENLTTCCKHDIGGTRYVSDSISHPFLTVKVYIVCKYGIGLTIVIIFVFYRSFPTDLVRESGRQLLESVAFMHDLCLIHIDLKPENILLVSSEYVKVPDYKILTHLLSRSAKDGSFFNNLPKSSAIKLIDFGSTTFEHENHTYVVSTCQYRALEVILVYLSSVDHIAEKDLEDSVEGPIFNMVTNHL
ncbi:hypothetical protein ACSBR2_008274 [Camellia fascicularis]